jgi:predicted transcriptional regulator
MKMESGSKLLDRYTFTSERSKLKIARILDVLSNNEMNKRQLAEESFMCYDMLGKYIKYLVDEKLIYISSWKLDFVKKTFKPIPYYKAGDKKSKKKPRPLTQKERYARGREKLAKFDELAYIKHIKRKAKLIKPHVDWATQWITPNSSIGQ